MERNAIIIRNGKRDKDRETGLSERVVFEWQYPESNSVERLIIVNQFAFIQTNDFAGSSDQVGKDN